MDTSAYRDMFVSEAREHLQNLNQSLLALEKAPSDMAAIQEIFRSAHTLKGMSATMGFKDMEMLCHRMENLLDRIRGGALYVDSRMASALFQALDALEGMTDRVQAGVDEPTDVTAIVAEIESFLPAQGTTPAPAPVPGAAAQAPEPAALPQGGPAGANAYEVKVSVARTCDMRGIRAYLVIQALAAIGRITSTVPDVKAIEEDRFDYEFTVFLETDLAADEVSKKALGVAEIAATAVAPRPKPSAKPPAPKPAALADKNSKGIHSVRIDIDRLDTIMNLVGELVISRGRLFEISNRRGILELNDTMTMLDRSITDLQNEVMRIRMLPVDHVFNRFPRIVRDLAQKQGKEIEVLIEGQDTELDRTVLDEISDPLNHLIRNSVDHGVELPAERAAAGKRPAATVHLTARRERSNVIIEVSDDGRGIDLARVRKKAVERGILTDAQAAAMSDDEALQLIFRAGFSTAEKVTEVSGRGVGMDIVRTKIDRLNGTVKVESKLGQGTRTILKLPPTIAIVQALLVNVGSEQYAISITNVVETVYLTDAEVRTIGGREVIVIRDAILPLYRVCDLFSVASRGNGRQTAVVVERGDEKVALLVDSIESQQEIFVKPLAGLLQSVKGLEGVTIMGNGSVVPILDVGTLGEAKP